MTAQTDYAPKVSPPALALIALLCGAGLFSYWTTLGKIAWRWSEDPQYSHGYLVPVFALYLLWLRRARLRSSPGTTNWLGLILLGAAAALRLAGARFHFEYFDQISLLPAVAGLFFLLGSWPALFWSIPAVLFLAFMIPLPHSASLALSAPMQSFATTVSTFFLQVLGKPAIAEGNVIHLNDIPLGIVEACSGLRMLVVFFALSTAIALLIRKPLWEKLLIAGSAIPIALASNVVRIIVTGLFFDAFGNHFGGDFFHDLFGYLMPVVGTMFLFLELWALKWLLIEPVGAESLPGQVVAARIEAPAFALYQGGTKPRREKPAVKPEIVTPVPAEVAV